MEIYDTVGRVEFKKLLQSGQNSIINVFFLKKGVYILRVHQNGKVSNIKILKN
ncbi:MAG: T9SS type A sorting domain-containing protein [Methanococcaceae archaeon]